jgi:RimJ/RimL family protein N-acetyltransferase
VPSAPHPLTNLRIRTPRIELRLGSVAELRSLARVVQQGTYADEAIPFSNAWLDGIHDPGFVDEFIEYHEGSLRDARPDHWKLELLVFTNGTPIGSQRLQSERAREVSTGSLLGRRYQRRGYGTEMRAAVLQFAFRHLDTKTAWSDAWTGNDASLAVSRKLGYVPVGTTLKSPRGEPVVHQVLRLERDDFQSTVPVEVDGLSAVLSWFGID